MKIIKNLRVSGLAPIGNGRGGRRTTARTVVFVILGLAAVTTLVGTALAGAPHMTGHESGETVARWNRNAISVLLPTNPPELTRSLAMTHIALHDAANAVRPKYERYAYHVTEDTGADPVVAVGLERGGSAVAGSSGRRGRIARLDRTAGMGTMAPQQGGC